MKTLYKKDTKGNIRYIKLYVIGNQLNQESGIVGTDSPVVNTRVCKPKNVGRSNETTAEQQAISEMESKFANKQSEGYFDNEYDAENEEVILPMLAKSYKNEKKKIDWTNAYAQPKLDGMRCLIIKKGDEWKMISRKGKDLIKQYNTLQHIINELALHVFIENITFDGELYAHDLTFQENMSAIKKLNNNTGKIRFVCYDCVMPTVPYSLRISEVEYQLQYTYSKLDSYVKVIGQVEVGGEESLKMFQIQALKDGYEGSMLRWGEEGYKINGRSSNLLKYKEFIDTALPLLDIVPQDRRPEFGTFIFEWKGAKGHEMGDDIIGCGMSFTEEERAGFLKNKQDYIGKTVELRYFELSDTGVPRFPVAVGFRIDL